MARWRRTAHVLAVRRRRLRSALSDGDAQPLIGLAVRVSLSTVVASLAAVPALVRRKLRVTVRTDQPQVLPSIVRRVPVYVVQHEREGEIQPHAGSAADRTAARLCVGEILANVVTLVAIDPRHTGFEPTLRTRLAPGRLLTCIAAVDLLAAFRELRSTAAALSHGFDAMNSYRQMPPSDELSTAGVGASYRD